MSDKTLYTLHFDGSCGPKNPGGMGGYGFILKRQGELVSSGHGELGQSPQMTNNFAEFAAVYKGLVAFARLTHNFRNTRLAIFGDSQIVIRILGGDWRANADKGYFPAYKVAHQIVVSLRQHGIEIDFTWIPREDNQECDDLSKAGPGEPVDFSELQAADALPVLHG